MLFFAQPTENLARRVPSNATQPITNRTGRIVNNSVCMVRHNHVADEFVRIKSSNLGENINEDFAGLVTTKNRDTVVRHKGDVVNGVRLI